MQKKFKLLVTILLIFIFAFCTFYTCFAEETTYVWSNNSTPVNSNENDKVTNLDNSLNLESESAILIEQSTGQILYEHNIHEQLRPASVTKVMSILLIMEALDSGKISLTDSVPCSEIASSMGGSQI